MLHPGTLPRVLYIVTAQDQRGWRDGRAQGYMWLRSCNRAQVCVQTKSTSVTVWFLEELIYGKENPSCPLWLFAACEYHSMELKPSTLNSRKDNTEEKNGLSIISIFLQVLYTFNDYYIQTKTKA